MFTTTDAKPRAAGEARVDLFGCPVWTTELDLSHDHVRSMLVDIDTRLAEFHADGVAGQHTGSVFQDRTEPWWTDYHGALLAATDQLASELDHPWTEQFLRTWGVRYETGADYRLGDSHLHNHMGKTYSCVFALTLPDAHQGTADGSTLLRNPMAGLLTSLGVNAEWLGPSIPLHGMIFPGFLEHQTAVPCDLDGPWDPPRVVLVSDVAYY